MLYRTIRASTLLFPNLSTLKGPRLSPHPSIWVLYPLIAASLSGLVLATTGALAQQSLPTSGTSTSPSIPSRASAQVDRFSPSFVDFKQRFRKSLPSNSIALLMIHDALRSHTKNLNNVRQVLEDHRNRISATESFRKGRHTFRIAGSLEGKIETPVSLQRFAGGHFGVSGSLDFDLLAKGRHLIATNGRIQRQTGLDFIVTDPIIEPTACAHVGGTITLPNLPLLSSSGKADAKVCYQYQPSSMTALAQFVAQNQRRLSRLERGFGKELNYLTDLFFKYGNSNCRHSPSSNREIRKSVGDSLAILHDSNLGLDIPVDVKTAKQLRAAFWADPDNQFLLEDSEHTRTRIAKLKDHFDGTLSDFQAYLIHLTAGQSDLDNALTALRDQQIHQGRSIKFLSDPDNLAKIFGRVMQRANSQLQKQQLLYRAMLKGARYGDLSNEDRKKKFALSIDNIQKDHVHYESYLTAAERTVTLLASFSGSTDFLRSATSTLSTIRSMGEFVKTARVLQEAYLAGVLTSVAGLAAYSNGVMATLQLTSAFLGTAQQNELSMLKAYFASRLDRLEDKIDMLADHTANNSMKLDALVRGQQAILESVAATMEEVQATRGELAFLTEMVRRLSFDFVESSDNIRTVLGASIRQQEQNTRQLLEVMRSKSVREIDVVIRNWLNPDSQVIKTLNEGGVKKEYLAIVRRDRQRVVEFIRALTTAEFVLPINTLVHADRLYDRPVSELMGLLPAYGERARDYDIYFQMNRDTVRVGNRFREGSNESSSGATKNHYSSTSGVGVFQNLPNPDVLAHVVRSYLTFLFALTPEARKELGTSDLEAVANAIERLKRSRKAAADLVQPALVGALSALAEAEHGISAQLTRKRLLSGSWADVRRKVLRSDIERDGVAVEVGSADGPAAATRRVLEADRSALVELAWLGESYLQRTGRSNGQAERKVLQRLAAMKKEEASAWLLDLRGEVEVDFPDIYRVLQNIAWLYELYEANELFSYSDEEWKFIKDFVRKSVLEISRNDVDRFVQTLKSSRGLLDVLRGEGVVKYSLSRDESIVDVEPARPGQAYKYGILEYVVEDRRTGEVFGETQDPQVYDSIERRKNLKYSGNVAFSLNGCRGARIIPAREYTKSPVPVPWGYRFTFPLDGGGFVRNPSNRLARDCDGIAAKVGAKIPHERPEGGYDPNQYQELVRSAENGWQGFIRDGRLARPGTELWYSGLSVCKVEARWARSNAHVYGGRRVTTLARFVLELADSPFVYWSQEMAEKERGKLFAEDGTVIAQNHARRCSYEGQHLTYHEHPSLITRDWAPVKGGAFPRQVLNRYWRHVDNRQIVLPGEFRSQIGRY